MLERLGVQNEWRDKSKLAFAKLQKMLDPSYKFEFADPATAGTRRPGRRRRPAPPAPDPARPDRGGDARPSGPSIRDPKDQARARDRARPARFCSQTAAADAASRRAAPGKNPASLLEWRLTGGAIELYVRALRAGLGIPMPMRANEANSSESHDNRIRDRYRRWRSSIGRAADL